MTAEDLFGQTSRFHQAEAQNHGIRCNADQCGVHIAGNPHRRNQCCVNRHTDHHQKCLKCKGEQPSEIIGSYMTPFTVAHRCERDRGKRCIEINLYHAPIDNDSYHHRHNFHAEADKEGFKSQHHQFTDLHGCHRRLHLHGQRTNINGSLAVDDTGSRINFEQGTVSLQDMTLAKEARYPIFRTEPLEYIRHLYEQADVPMKEAIETTVFTALHNAGVAYEDFSPEQMDVIYSVAESGGELEELLNPDFSPEQMQLIADVQTRTDAIHRSAVDDVLNPLTSKPMTPEEVNHARRQHNLPLDSGAETEQPVQPKQEPMNFSITDDDLGAGGAKTKFKANIEAIRLLQTLDAEQRQATAEEQEVLSRYVGWGGIPQAFDEKNADWAKEYAELKSLLPADEYSEARASTLNAFYTSPTVIKAMYEVLGYVCKMSVSR